MRPPKVKHCNKRREGERTTEKTGGKHDERLLGGNRGRLREKTGSKKNNHDVNH